VIFRKIVKVVATRCHILKLKCIKFDFSWGFGWGSVPDPVGSLRRSPDPLVGFKGPTSKGKEGMEGRKKGGEGKGGEREGRAVFSVQYVGNPTPEVRDH